MEPRVTESSANNGEMAGEETLSATVATRKLFVPEFSEAGCRLDALLDLEADSAMRSRALVGGKPPVIVSETSSLSNDVIEEEEEIQVARVSEAYATYGNPVITAQEEQLVSFHVDRSVRLENIGELLSQQNNPTKNCTNKITTIQEAEPIEITDASFAFSPPPNCGAKNNTAVSSTDASRFNKGRDNNLSALSKSPEYSGNIDSVISPPPEFASASCGVQSSDSEELIKPLVLERNRINLTICSEIPLTKLDYRPKDTVETDSINDEEIIEYSEASIAHSAAPGFTESDAEAVSEEEFTVVKLPKKSLDHSILNNELFRFVTTEYRRPERVITESDEEEAADDQKVSPEYHSTLDASSGDHVIIPQRRISSKYSAGVAIKSSEPPSPVPAQQGTGNNTSLATPPTDDTKSSPKVKSKGFFSLFKKSPKPARAASDVKNSEKSKSLPRNLPASAAEAEGAKQENDKKSPTKKSGFFSFGSRGKGKVNKSQTLEKPPANTSTAVSKPAESKTVPTSGKSNIRVFEIMAENGAAVPKDTVVKAEEPIRKEEGGLRFEPEPVSASVMKPNESVAASSPAAEARYTAADQERGKQAIAPEIIVDHPQPLTQNIHQQQPKDFDVNKYMVVVAIDFGTAFSGYAFSFVKDPESIHMMSRWEGGDPGIINQKTPTILLLNPEGQFHSFGFTARNHYHDLSPEDSLKWLYFDKFKMGLYNNSECNRQTLIEAANGQKFSALEAVRITLSFFKDHALQELSDQCGVQMINDDVRWIVTVPAIWNASAKQFMRQAAYGAGLASPDAPEQLVVALEPEAAAIHIRKLRLYQLVPEKPTATLPLSIRKLPQGPIDQEIVSSQFKTVTRYMVVDCGGGTVDITVHDINAVSGLLTEVYKATGGAHGSCGIDADFETLLCTIFGEDFITSYKKNRPSGWVALMLAFESRKRAASPFRVRQPLNVAFPFSFIEYHRKLKGSTVEKAISDFRDPEIRWSSQGMLRISYEAIKLLFKKTADGIVHSVAEVFNKVNGVQNIFLVGGLSESPVIQQAIRDQFSHKTRIVVPQEANLAVLKGAVCFGLDPGVVVERRSKLTYGAAVLHRFIPGKHPQSKLIHRDGVDWCRDVFDQLVVVDQIVRREEPVVRSYTPASSTQPHITINLYSTEHNDVQFVTDPRVRQCATITLDLMQGSSFGPARRKIQTFMSFAETEIKVTALDTTTGEKVDAAIDFFSS